jgi:hypothetical protein
MRRPTEVGSYRRNPWINVPGPLGPLCTAGKHSIGTPTFPAADGSLPMRERIKERISEWYYGRWEPFEPPIVGGAHNPHWTARIAQTIVNFWERNWQWIIATCITLGGVIVAVIALKR